MVPENSPRVDDCSPSADSKPHVSGAILSGILPAIDDTDINFDSIPDIHDIAVAHVPTTAALENLAQGTLQPEDIHRLLAQDDISDLPLTNDNQIDIRFLDGMPNLEFDLHEEPLLLQQPELKSPEDLGNIHVPVPGMLGDWGIAQKQEKESSGSKSVETVAACGKEKDTRDSTREEKTAAARQRRYRERKKNKQLQIESEVAALRQKAEALKLENSALKQKQEVIRSVLKNCYQDDMYENLMDETPQEDSRGPERRLPLEGHEPSIKTAENNSVGHVYLDVLDDFDGKKQDKGLKDNKSQQNVSLDSMYLVFLQKVDALVKQYESCPDNSPEQKSVEQDLGRLLELRTKALTDMAAKQPGLVLKHLVDGWLGEVLGDGTLGDNPMTSASPALRALIQGMNLTSEQMSEFCCIWKQFALAWSKRVPKDLDKCISKLPGNPNIQEVFPGQSTSTSSGDCKMDPLSARGMHGALEDAYYLQILAEQDLDIVSQNQATMVLELGQKIFSILSPIQRGRLWVLQSKILNARINFPKTCQQRDAPTIATFSNTITYFRILQIFNPAKMQATLAFTARPLAVRRSAAQTSARTTLVVRAENKEARTRSAIVKPATLTVLSNAIMAMGAHAETGKIFDFNMTLPIMAGQFLLLMVFLDKSWFTPVGKLLDDRDTQLREKLATVKGNSGEVASLQAEAEKIISEARAAAQKKVGDAKAAVSSEAASELAAAKAKVDAELSKALASLESEKDAALKGLDAQVAKLSDDILSRVLPEGVKV
ncbi:ATP synthase subunit b' [Picochlorum sp. SENEW3]|nr:ATP synthase subunit b' [Picochlorum sp. SENEW3]